MKQALAKADAAALLARMEADKQITLELKSGPVVLDALDVQVRLQAKEGWAAAQGAACVVVLSTELNEQLLAEGLAREVVHGIQTLRKDKDCEYTDRIAVGIETDDASLREAVAKFRDYIQSETLAVRIEFGPLAGVEPVELKLGGATVKIYIQVVSA